jgi:hypothetical protein
VGNSHVTASTVTSRASSDAIIEAFSRMLGQGFIGETEAGSLVVIGQFSVEDSCGRFVVGDLIL